MENLPIERAKMRLKIQVPVSCRADLAHYLFDKGATVESEDLGIRSNQVSHPCLTLPSLTQVKSHGCDEDVRMHYSL